MKNCKRILPILIALLAMLMSLAAFAAETKEVLITNCDNASGWQGGLGTDKREKTEGKASIVKTFRPKNTTGIVLYYPFNAVNGTGMNTLEFDLYISHPDFFEHTADCSIELTSSGTWDQQEASWSPKRPLTEGWNKLVLPIPENTCIMSRINFFRLYGVGIEPYTSDNVVIRIDNMRLTYRDPSLFGPTVPSENIGKLHEATSSSSTAIPSGKPITVPGTETYLREEFRTAAIVLFSVAGAFLIAFVLLLCFKKKIIGIISICLCLMLVGGGAYSFIRYREPQTRDIQVPIPQMDMEKVEQMLAKDQEFDKKEAYKLLYTAPEDQDDAFEIPEEMKKYDFKKPTLIKSDYNTDQYYVAETTVIAFGARGDGIHNDTQAFQSAISYVERQGGGTIFVPAGKYVLTAGLTLPMSVSLVGELTPGTVDGTVIMIYGSKGNAGGPAAFSMNFHSGLKNMAFWYPEQTFVGGAPIPYPPTVRQIGTEGITLENLNFVNSYHAMDLAYEGITGCALQVVRDIYGTPLYLGFDNRCSLDIGRFEGIHFAPEYWLLSDLPGVPEQQLLTTWMLRNATAIRIGRVDWTYYTDVHIKGYKKGIEYYIAPTGSSNGHLYNSTITECYYAVYSECLSHLNYTSVTLSACGNDGAVALYFAPKATTAMNLNSCRLLSEGKNAIYNNSASNIAMLGCEVQSVDGSPLVITKKGLYSATNTTFVGANPENYRSDKAEVAPLPEVDYDRVVNTKPKSDRFINLTDDPYRARPNSDISKQLQRALDDLKETGGTVYLPGGTYRLDSAVTVWEGIELCGVQDVAHYFPHTTIKTDYGYKKPSAEALITLKAGAGIRGIGIMYDKIAKYGASVPAYAYTIRGDGAGVYVVNCTIPFTYNGVDFATNRCDNHYIESLWGCAANNGIQVGGGSENGIIRDCMFTQNTSWTVKGDGSYIGQIQPTLFNQSVTFRVGKTKNQIVYHTFVFAAYKGLEITDGAENCVVISHGTDYGNNSVYLSGNSSVTLIDPQMVAIVGNDKYYIHTDESFTGSLTVHNAACWGNPRSAFMLKGAAQYRFYSTYLSAIGGNVFTLGGGSLELAGLTHTCSSRYDVEASDKVTSVSISGTLSSAPLSISIPDSVKLSGDDIPKEN